MRTKFGVLMNDTATLSNEGNMTIFQFGDQRIKFKAPDCLIRYVEIKTWEKGYIEVMTEYESMGIEEEYIDLVPILKNLYINPEKFLSPIRNLTVK